MATVAAAARDEAVHAFDTALSLAADVEPEEQGDLLHKRGSARLSLGHREEFSSDLREALKRFEALGLGDKAAAVVSELAYMLVSCNRMIISYFPQRLTMKCDGRILNRLVHLKSSWIIWTQIYALSSAGKAQFISHW